MPIDKSEQLILLRIFAVTSGDIVLYYLLVLLVASGDKEGYNKQMHDRLRGGTPWRYDGKASCMSKQIVINCYTGFGDHLKDDEHPSNKL